MFGLVHKPRATPQVRIGRAYVSMLTGCRPVKNSAPRDPEGFRELPTARLEDLTVKSWYSRGAPLGRGEIIKKQRYAQTLVITKSETGLDVSMEPRSQEAEPMVFPLPSFQASDDPTNDGSPAPSTEVVLFSKV